MADRNHSPPLSVRLSREEHEWLSGLARREGTSVHALASHAVWLLRFWEEKAKGTLAEALELIDSASREYEKELRRERNLRRGYETLLWAELDYDQWRLTAMAEACCHVLCSPTVAKLLALAVCSDSDYEASAAFARARALHRGEELVRARCTLR
jgi:hypothetical protein